MLLGESDQRTGSTRLLRELGEHRNLELLARHLLRNVTTLQDGRR
jgi:hypothetical protein